MISLIVAHDKNRVIGYEKKMPWHLPGDLQYFKEVTMGKPMIMGRKTFESIGRPLPGRKNIVITRNLEYQADGIIVVPSLDEALKEAGDVEEIMIIGGEQIFSMSMAIADRLYITYIDYEFPGDTYFPQYETVDWELVSQKDPVQTPEGFTFQYLVYDRGHNAALLNNDNWLANEKIYNEEMSPIFNKKS